MAKNPCKFFLPDGTALSYDEMRAFMLENYSLLKPIAESKAEPMTESEKEEMDAAEEDGFSVPTEAEMQTKREKLKEDYEKSIANLKEKFSDLISKNLGFAYDPKAEAKKMFDFHIALVDAMKAAIRLGMNDVADFARAIGKSRVDKFTQRAWDDAQFQINQQPAIINTEEDMLNATYQKVAEMYNKQYADAEAAKKPFIDRLIVNINKGAFEADYVAKKMLKSLGAIQAFIDKTLLAGASSKSKVQFENYQKEIFGGLTEVEKKLLNNIIQAETIISIDTRFDAKGETRPKHPEDTTMEEQKVFLGQLAESNPELYNKLNDRATKYFDAQRDLLKERLDEGRISIDSYNSMVNNNYSPRKFLEYMLEDNLAEGLKGQGSVSKSDINSLSDGDLNSLFHDAEWLLSTNVLATNRAIFHNRANRSLYDFALANPNNGLIDIQTPRGYNDKTGQPIYPDPKVGFKQIQFFNDGVLKSVVVPNEFFESWVDTAPLMSPAFANAARVATGGSIKRMFTTGVNPVFALKNFPRDVSHTLFFTNVYSPSFPVALGQLAVDLTKTFKDAMKMDVKKKDSRYYQYLTEGGGMDFLSIQGKPIYKTSLIKTKFDNGVDALSSTLGFFNNRTEVWVRLAIREREINKGVAKFLRDNGRSPNDAELERIKRNATFHSRNQMDFSRGGKYAKAVDNFIPYFNASLQGLSVSSRYIHDNPKMFAIKLAQAAAVITALTLYNSRYKDDEDDIPEEEKARNFIFLLPYTVTKGEYESRPYIRIPKTQSIQPWATMIEAMAEWGERGVKPKKAGRAALEAAFPIPNPQNIPVIDAMNLYSSNYDRFLDKKVYKNEETTLDKSEYVIGVTPQMWIDIGEKTNLSPERLKEAVGKLTADPDNNIYYVLAAQGYDALFKEVPEEDKKEYTEIFNEALQSSLTPFQRSFMSYTNPNLKKKSVSDLEEELGGKEKLQNDTVSLFVKRYIKDEDTELNVKRDFNEWVRTQNADSVDTERLKTKFNYSIQFKEVDNVFWRMRSSKNPQVRANILFADWIEANENDRKLLEFRAELLDLAPKDRNSKFWQEFNRLKENYGK